MGSSCGRPQSSTNAKALDGQEEKVAGQQRQLTDDNPLKSHPSAKKREGYQPKWGSVGDIPLVAQKEEVHSIVKGDKVLVDMTNVFKAIVATIKLAVVASTGIPPISELAAALGFETDKEHTKVEFSYSFSESSKEVLQYKKYGRYHIWLKISTLNKKEERETNLYVTAFASYEKKLDSIVEVLVMEENEEERKKFTPLQDLHGDEVIDILYFLDLAQYSSKFKEHHVAGGILKNHKKYGEEILKQKIGMENVYYDVLIDKLDD